MIINFTIRKNWVPFMKTSKRIKIRKGMNPCNHKTDRKFFITKIGFTKWYVWRSKVMIGIDG